MTSGIHKTIHQIHSRMDLEELLPIIEDALKDHCSASAFTILILNDQSGELEPFFSTLPDDSTGAEGLAVLSQELRPFLDSQSCGLFRSAHPWKDIPPPAAAAALEFKESRYGLLVIHTRDRLADGGPELEALAVLSRECGSEIIKLQLYGAVDAEARLAMSKINAINSTAELLKNLDLHVLLTKLMDVALNIVNAQVGSIMLKRDNRLQTEVEFGLTNDVMHAIKTGDGDRFVDTVLAAGDPLLISDMTERDDIDMSGLNVSIQSMIVIPLVTKTARLGLINIVNTDGEFDQSDYDILITISSLSAAAVENAVLQEQQIESERLKEQMQIAQSIQMSLLPHDNPTVPGLDIAGWSIPCDETGGDYYDYIMLDEHRLAVVLGDASGHGLGAALTMLNVRASLRGLLFESFDLDRVFYSANNRVESDTDDQRFMTAFCGIFDLQKKELQYCSAGHEGPIWFREGQPEPAQLDSTGPPLGVISEVDFELTPPYPLQAGDILLMGTDGTWEAQNSSNQLFGKERLIQLVQENSQLCAEELGDMIRKQLQAFLDKPANDDMTLIVIKVTSRE